MMKLGRFLPEVIMVLLVLCGCSSTDAETLPKREFTSYAERKFETGYPLQLSIDNDSGNIEVYSWDRYEVKFEATSRVRGIQPESVMKNEFKNFDISAGKTSDIIAFGFKYRGKLKNPSDRRVDLKVYIPKRIDRVSIKLGTGCINFYDDIKCEMNIEVNTANISLNKFTGKVKIAADAGNLKISSGELASGSGVEFDSGNIFIKTLFGASGDYSFETGMGNVDISLPADSAVIFECVGNVARNDFEDGSYDSTAMVKSGIGRISIARY